MPEQGKRITGQTRATGFQVGARRTFSIAHEAAWQMLTSAAGVRVWLGDAPELEFTRGARYQLPVGTTGEVRVFSPNSHLRLTWQPPGWARPSTIQLRTIPKGEKTVVAFHQEHMPGTKEREERRAYYLAVLDKLVEFFKLLDG